MSFAFEKDAHETGQPSAVVRWAREGNLNAALIGIISAAFFLFAALRIFSVAFTHDESYSYLQFVSSVPFKDVLSRPECSSANHLLNTLFMKVATLAFYPDNWTLRLHSLAAYVLFLFAGYHVCRQLFKPSQQLAVIILLNMNMFLLQFFSLARGYGLGLGLMMVSLWLFLRALDPDSNRRLLHALALIFAAIACWANLIFLNYYCALLLLGMMIRLHGWLGCVRNLSLVQRITALINACWDAMVVTALLAATLIPFALKLRKLEQFYYGGKTGFIEDTVVSLINAYLYKDSIPQQLLPDIIRWVWLVFGVLLAFYVFIAFRARHNLRIAKASFVYWIMLVSAISIQMQHLVLGTVYPFDRAAVFFLPLFVLSVAWFLAWDWIQKPVLMRYKTWLLLLAAICLSGWQFLRVANMRYALPWKYDAETVSMLNDLEQVVHDNGSSDRVRLGITWYFQPGISFYSKVRGLDWLAPVDRDGIKDRVFDYYYVADEDLDSAKSAGASPIKHYDLSATWLMRAGPR